MRKLVVSLHSTANDIVTGPPSDRTNLDWARAGVEDSTEPLLTSMSTVDTILLGRATYEDLVTKWPLVEESPDEDAGARLAEKINTTPKVVVTGGHPAGALEWGRFAPLAHGAILVKYATLDG